MRYISSLSLLALLLSPVIAIAASAPPAAVSAAPVMTAPAATDTKTQKNPWDGTNASFGGVLNTGNISSQNVTAGANLQYAQQQWTYIGQGSFQRTQSSDKGVTAQKLYLLGQTQYSFSQQHFAYTQLNYTNDRFSGYNYVSNWLVGYGRHFDFNQQQTLDVFFGPGVRASETTAGQNSTLPAFQVGANYAWPINETTTFTEQLQTTAASDDIYTSSQTAMTTSLTDKLAMQVGFLVTNDSKPQPGKTAVNTTTTLQLVYNF